MKSESEKKQHVARENALICHVNQTLYSITQNGITKAEKKNAWKTWANEQIQ